MTEKHSFIKKLIGEKKFDIRKIYVGIPARQSSLKIQPGIWEDHYSWEFESINGEVPKFDLFTKTLTGYKSILSGVDYQVSSIHTSNKIVVVKKSIHLLGRFDPELITIIKEKYGSYNVNKDVVKMIKQTINKELVNINEAEATKEI